LNLPLPGKHFASAHLETRIIDPAELVRISKFATGEPFFGRYGVNRFDDPRKKFGTCYFGFSLPCAFAETVLHDEVIDEETGGFRLAPAQLDRHVMSFSGKPLTVAVLHGVALKRLGGNGSISSILPYDIPRAWSLAIHNHKAAVDGFVYMSRHLNSEEALVLFGRAKRKLSVASSIAFADLPDAVQILADFGVIPV
jgi:hypothetical protein